MSTTVPVYQALVITSAARDQAPISNAEIQHHYDEAVHAMCPMTSSYCQAAIPTAAEYKRPMIPGITSLQLDTALIIARHGDRAPDHVLADDLSGNVSWDCDAIGSMTLPESKIVVAKVSDTLFETWAPRTFKGTCALGDLTAKGRTMHVEFGRQVRAIYVEQLGLLSRRLTPNELHLRSTDTGRTIGSSLSFLDGLYPHGTHNRNQRVTIRTLSHQVDTMNLYGIEQQCPKLAKLKALAKDHPMWDQIMNATAAARVQIATIAPEDGVEPVADASMLRVPAQIDSLMCRRCWGKPQPCRPGAGCLPEATIDDGWLVKSLTYWYRDNYFPNRVQPEIIPLAVGPLFREILGILDGTMNRRSNRQAKLHVFMGHDGTLSGMLGALRAAPEQHQWPAYRSNLILEVWSGAEKAVHRKFVRILIDGRPLVTDLDLVGDELMPWCHFGGEHGETCPLDAFIAFLQAHSVEDWSEACKV
ncbi:Lysophosphatidic acid phosphatase type 6 [Allomyces arbusculus]|nr:Lysophosphatidic acid phosphatase type 6 [Allomyces arbusculus]